MNYQWSDVWLLQSIIMAAGRAGATLEAIISVGDFLNHALFSEYELESGIEKLIEGKLISQKGKNFFPTAQAIKLLQKAKEHNVTNNFKIRENLEKLLGVIAQPGNSSNYSLKYNFFTSLEFREAQNRYLKSN